MVKKSSTSSLVYSTDRAAIIRLAKQKGKSCEEIVLILTRGYTYEECRIMAPVWAKELEITFTEFMIFARRRRKRD